MGPQTLMRKKMRYFPGPVDLKKAEKKQWVKVGPPKVEKKQWVKVDPQKVEKKQCRKSGFIYAYIPPYIFIYLHILQIALYTFIYLHIHQNSQY